MNRARDCAHNIIMSNEFRLMTTLTNCKYVNVYISNLLQTYFKKGIKKSLICLDHVPKGCTFAPASREKGYLEWHIGEAGYHPTKIKTEKPLKSLEEIIKRYYLCIHLPQRSGLSNERKRVWQENGTEKK